MDICKYVIAAAGEPAVRGFWRKLKISEKLPGAKFIHEICKAWYSYDSELWNKELTTE